MPNSNIKFTVDPELIDKGIKIKVATFSVPKIVRRQGSELKNHIKEVIKSLNPDELLQSSIIKAYKKSVTI